MIDPVIERLRTDRVNDLKAALSEFKLAIVAIDPTARVFLFGSYSRGDFDLHRSDIDVWIKCEKDKVFDCLEFGIDHFDEFLARQKINKSFDLIVKDFVPSNDKLYDFLEL